MSTVCYIRVSSTDQNTDKQKKAIVTKRRKGMTPTKLAKEYGVSRGLIYNIIGEGGEISPGSRLPQGSSSKV